MPLRGRGIGPAVSQDVAAILRERREELGWSRPRLSGEVAKIAPDGESLSAATITSIESGISEHGKRRTRLITVDEASILARAMDITITIGDELWAGTAGRGVVQGGSPQDSPWSGQQG